MLSAFAIVRALRGDVDEARREFLEDPIGALLVRRLDIAAESHVRDGNSEHAVELVTRIEATYPADPWVIGIGARHRAAVAVDEAKCRHWTAVALDSLDSSRAPLDRVRMLVTVAELTPSMVESVAAEFHWAVEFCDRGGLVPIGDRLLAALRDAGFAVQRRASPSAAVPSMLSAREREVARHAAHGCTVAEIGRRLFISPHTVSTHLQRTCNASTHDSKCELARRWCADSSSWAKTYSARDRAGTNRPTSMLPGWLELLDST